MQNPYEMLFNKLEKMNEKIEGIDKILRDGVEPEVIQDTFMTIGEVAEMIKMSESSIYRLTKTRNLPVMRQGGKLWFSKNRVLEWMKTGE